MTVYSQRVGVARHGHSSQDIGVQLRQPTLLKVEDCDVSRRYCDGGNTQDWRRRFDFTGGDLLILPTVILPHRMALLSPTHPSVRKPAAGHKPSMPQNTPQRGR